MNLSLRFSRVVGSTPDASENEALCRPSRPFSGQPDSGAVELFATNRNHAPPKNPKLHCHHTRTHALAYAHYTRRARRNEDGALFPARSGARSFAMLLRRDRQILALFCTAHGFHRVLNTKKSKATVTDETWPSDTTRRRFDVARSLKRKENTYRGLRPHLGVRSSHLNLILASRFGNFDTIPYR
jgi:hypothetical protein